MSRLQFFRKLTQSHHLINWMHTSRDFLSARLTRNSVTLGNMFGWKVSIHRENIFITCYLMVKCWVLSQQENSKAHKLTCCIWSLRFSPTRKERSVGFGLIDQIQCFFRFLTFTQAFRIQKYICIYRPKFWH